MLATLLFVWTGPSANPNMRIWFVFQGLSYLPGIGFIISFQISSHDHNCVARLGLTEPFDSNHHGVKYAGFFATLPSPSWTNPCVMAA